MKKGKLYIETLGCPKNRVDAEIFLKNFLDKGWEITDKNSDADLIILNSCAFIEDSRKESIERFFELENSKKENAKMVLSGCLAQLYPNIQDELVEADIISGIDSVAILADEIEKYEKGHLNLVKSDKKYIYLGEERVLTQNPFFAYLKIADGCDNWCSYCSIPVIRGKYRERTIDSIVKEAIMLEKSGVKEIDLIAQDTTVFGKSQNLSLADLIKALDKNLTAKIRIMYLYPSGITDEILNAIKNSKVVMPYFEIPLQHTNNQVLKDMNRHYKIEEAVAKIEQIKQLFGEKAIFRTTFISGFPTETLEAHNDLKNFIKQDYFDYIGVFSYSSEEFTKAGKMQPLDKKIAEKRFLEIKQEAENSMERRLKRFVGKETEILFEEIDNELYLSTGRTIFQAPEVDGLTYLANIENEIPGNFYKIKITERNGVDFVGEIIK